MRSVGRPPKFESPEQLEGLINKYLTETLEGEITLTGLCLSMGTTRETLDDYQSKPEYKALIKQAKLIVENSYEISLRKNGRTGDIFALKNFGWSDKTTLAGDPQNPIEQNLTVKFIG